MDRALFAEEFEAVGTDEIITDWGEVLPSVAESIVELEYLKYLTETSLFPALPMRVIEKITADLLTGCWVSEAALMHNGYSRLYDEKLKKTRAGHCYVWEKLVEPIPDEMQLDHRCRQRACVWPRHMNYKTHADNTRQAFYDRFHTLQPHFWQLLRERS